MQIVSSGDNLHEMSNPPGKNKKKNAFNLSSAEWAQSVVKVKVRQYRSWLHVTKESSINP